MWKTWLWAGMALCTLSGSSFGAIVYSGSQNVTVGVGDKEGIEIAGDTGDWDDLSVSLWEDTMAGGNLAQLSAGLPTSMGVGPSPTAIASGMGTVFRLDFGDPINDSLHWETGNHWRLSFAQPGGVTWGEFGATGGYVGLRLEIPGGSPHFGWLHMSGMTDLGLPTQTMTFDGWAYETDPDTAIAAGDTGDVTVPVPGAFMLSAIGIGLVARRGRRKRI